jgi:hypothetical protein
VKTSTWQKLARERIVPHVPDCHVAGNMLVFGVVDQILHGLYADSSSFDASRVAMHMFSQPLYIPSENVVLTFGTRLRHPEGGEWWELDDSGHAIAALLHGIAHEVLPFFKVTATPQDLAAYISTHKRSTRTDSNPNVIEVEAYSLVLAGHFREARDALERLERAVNAMPSTKTWGQRVLNRSLLVRRSLTPDSSEAIHLLGVWRNETVSHLKLERLTRAGHPDPSGI